MKQINEDKLEPMVLDLTVNSGQLNEGWLRMFGNWIRMYLGHTFGLNDHTFKVKGTRRQINSLAKTLGAEKQYMKAFKSSGLSDPSTMRSKSKLQRAISVFEKATGIKWPLK